MESIGYIINRKFILIAVDTNYQTEVGKIKIKMDRARKVHKLNNFNLISVIGNPYKTTDVFKYVLKLNELGGNTTFEKIVEDLKDVFDSSKTDTNKGIDELSKLIPKFQDESGYMRMEEMIEHLKDKPELISILKETTSAMNSSSPALSQVLVFGWDPLIKQTRLAYYVSIGQNLEGSELEKLDQDLVYFRLSSAKVKPSETLAIESELVQQLSPLITVGCDEDSSKVVALIEKGKQLLAKGLKKISPYEESPNIIYYELSERTNFSFQEPELKLQNIEYNRNK